jgi:hypothetical protein
MQKVVYSMEQMQELSRRLNQLSVTGIEQSKTVVYMATIIDSPLTVIEEPMEGIEFGNTETNEKGE